MARLFHAPVARVVSSIVRGADAAATARVAGDRARRVDADSRARPGRARRSRRFCACLNRLMFDRPPEKDRRCRVLYVSPLKALAVDVERNLRAPLAGHRERGDGGGHAVSPAADRHAHRRHAVVRAGAISPRPGRHPDHDARVALPAADLERTRATAIGRDGDHRRDSRAGLDQARRAPRAVAGAARSRSSTSRCSASGCRRRSGHSTKWRGFSAAPRSKVAHEGTAKVAKARSAKDAKDAKSGAQGPGDLEDVVHDEFATPAGAVQYRPVTIVDASEPKRLDITVQVPIEDMAKVADGAVGAIRSGSGGADRRRRRRFGRRSIRGCSS